ncbi:hypothetical protein M422DRAFT_267764 [Sphaerobolus stellatus SS14]|uniref:Uncharacterized protein n=1 Tax=Sphaerobolus stellatus (strain SS14) TaxID=990650 RepID=A0A0C9UYW8_SPHS4|nr:hypothetical protein M422DRAFT_267764 [Sphaerobolus stellatus SS14]
MEGEIVNRYCSTPRQAEASHTSTWSVSTSDRAAEVQMPRPLHVGGYKTSCGVPIDTESQQARLKNFPSLFRPANFLLLLKKLYKGMSSDQIIVQASPTFNTADGILSSNEQYQAETTLGSVQAIVNDSSISGFQSRTSELLQYFCCIPEKHGNADLSRGNGDEF